MSRTSLSSFAPMVLRFGMAALFLWFGIMQILDTQNWTGWVPAWAVSFSGLSPYEIVLLNGVFETVGGIALVIGLYVRVVAFALAVHLFLVAFDIGYTAIGVRDFCLACGTFATALYGSDQWSLDAVLRRIR